MITTRTPLRVSFAGGGTDLPSFYREYGGGAVVSTAVDRFVYVSVNTKFTGGVRVSYSHTENVDHADQVEHPLVRECLRTFSIDKNIEIVSIADIPGEGTGLGSSSSFTVGLLHALAEYTNRTVTGRDLAELACKIEIDVLEQPIGKQDQYAATFGGTNVFGFEPDGYVHLGAPIKLDTAQCGRINRNLLLLWTGITRSANGILSQQCQIADPKRITKLKLMRSQVQYMAHHIQEADAELIGRDLDAQWAMKRELVEGISSTQIDDWYLKCKKAGAWGGKLLGAGGGGFLLMVAPAAKHMGILAAVPDLTITPISINAKGTTLIYKDRD